MKLWVLMCFVTFSLQAFESLKLGLIPWNTPEQMLKDYEPTRKLLEKKLDIPVSLTVTKDYKEVFSRFRAGAINMMLIGGNQFAKYYDQDKSFRYLATVKTDINGEAVDHYNSLIIAHRDSGIKTMEDLKGKNFSFTDKGSGSGYVIPSLVFASSGIRPESYFSRTLFLKKHPKVYAAVAKRSVDAGAASNEIWKESVEKHGDIFHIIKKSPDLPLDAFVIKSGVTKEEISRIQTILKSAEYDEVFKGQSSSVKGYTIRSESFYDTYKEAQQFLASE